MVSVVGARSELVKSAPVTQVLAQRHESLVIHTGRRFDYGTSEAFFADLGVPPPDRDLGLGRGTHAEVVGAMLKGLSPILREARPDWVLVYGCSNATLAGALASATLGLPVAHVEAGVRSFRRGTPDELNHIVVDHVSRLHFCPSDHAVRMLAEEGLTEGVHQVGDVLLDHVFSSFERARREIAEEQLRGSLGLEAGEAYAFATVHHLENTEDELRLGALIEAFSSLPWPVVLPLHPGTQDSLQNRPELVSRIGANVRIVDPLRPLEALMAIARAEVVLTDSGGLQREAFFLGVPCITLRDDTEWVETLDLSANTVVGADAATILAAAGAAVRAPRRGPSQATPFGDGRAGERVVEILETCG